jgi:hypothetical protein
MIKVDIFQQGRYIGRLRIKDRWHGIVPIDFEEIKQEVEQRLPTLRHSKYSIAFA